MTRFSAVDAHEAYVSFMRERGHIQVDAVVYAWEGSGFSMFLRGIIGPLTFKRRFLVATESRLQVWTSPEPGEAIDLLGTFDRPVAELSTRIQLDRVTVEGRPFLVEVWQRPYLRQLLELAATPPTVGIVGQPAAWCHNPWALPGPDAQLRYWDGAQWTGHVYPVADGALSR